MPSHNTFSIKPIGAFVQKYLRHSEMSVDPFARDKEWATFTNDLNPETKAQYHIDAVDFLAELKNKGVRVDLAIFDPPYSPRQIKECYDGIGQKMEQMDAFRTHWKPERDLINDLLIPGGIVLSFGWNSIGMGNKRGYEFIDGLLVCHGPGHNDTICIAERKLQVTMFDVLNQSAGRYNKGLHVSANRRAT